MGKIYFALRPGHIRSKYDAQRHYIGVRQLVRCYNLPEGTYRLAREADYTDPNIIVLGPTYDYDETLIQAIAMLGYPSPVQTVTIDEVLSILPPPRREHYGVAVPLTPASERL